MNFGDLQGIGLTVPPGGTSIDQIGSPWWQNQPLGYCYEFDAVQSTTQLPPGWSWYSQGANSYSENFGRGVVVLNENSGQTNRGIFRDIDGSAQWTVTIGMRLRAMTANNGAGQYPQGGIFLSDGGSKALVAHWANISGSAIYMGVWNNNTTQTTDLGNVSLKDMDPRTSTHYWRIVYDAATDITFQISVDGVYWETVLANYNVTTGSAASFTPTKVGVSGSSFNVPVTLGMEWWRTTRTLNTP